MKYQERKIFLVFGRGRRMSWDSSNVNEFINLALNHIKRDCYLSKKNEDTISEFFHFCVNQKSNSRMVPYSLLIEYDNQSVGVNLAVKLSNAACILMDSIKPIKCKEQDFFQYLEHPAELKERTVFLITDMMKEEPENWAFLSEELRKYPQIIKIYLKDINDNISRFETDSYFRWRMLNLHIEKSSMGIDDVCEYLKYCLEQRHIFYTDEFWTEIVQYVNTVYPNAMLAEEEFVFDLCDAVEQRALGRTDASAIYDVDCVPLYNREEKSEVTNNSREDIGDIVENHDNVNLLVLALSTRTPKGEVSKDFYVEDNGKEIIIPDCQYQLEPVVKYMISKFRGESVRIIELCTADTYVGFPVGEVEPKDNRSAREFFENRIDEYKGLYKCDVSYETIDIDEANMSEGLVSVAEKLKAINENINGKFWIDTHGGFRDVTIMCNSLISLLKAYDIRPDRILGVRNPSRTDTLKKSLIVDQEESFKVNEFVAGMNEFIEYGSASILDRYIRGSQMAKNEKIMNVVKAMVGVSDGTKLCDPTQYKKALNTLSAAVKEYGEGTSEIFDIFVDYIKKSYGILLDNANRTNFDIVKRCNDKGMYQQALTFIESLMPEDYSNAGLLYYDTDDEEKINELSKTMKKSYLTKQHFVFDSFGLNMHYFEDQDNNKDRNAIMALDTKYDDILEDFSIPDGVVKFQLFDKGNIKELGQIEYFTNLQSEIYCKKFGKLIRLHKALKECRNMTNHATERQRPQKKNIEVGLNHYIELYEELVKCDELKGERQKGSGKSTVYKNDTNNEHNGEKLGTNKKSNYNNKKDRDIKKDKQTTEGLSAQIQIPDVIMNSINDSPRCD